MSTGGIAPPYLTLALDGGSNQLNAPVAIHVIQRKIIQYPLDRRLRGPQSRYGCYGEDKKQLPLPEIQYDMT
jgi:hypothetical protein